MELKVPDLQADVRLAQKGKCQTLNQRSHGQSLLDVTFCCWNLLFHQGKPPMTKFSIVCVFVKTRNDAEIVSDLLLYAEKYQFIDLTKNDKMFPRIPSGTRIGKYDLFIPSPERKWEPYENDEKIKSGVVVSGSGVNDGTRALTWAQALGPTVFSSPLTVSTKKKNLHKAEFECPHYL